MSIVNEEWEKFAQVYRGTTADKLLHLRRAFYSGAFAIIIRTQNECSEGDESTPEDEALFASVMDELHNYLAQDVNAALKEMGKGTA